MNLLIRNNGQTDYKTMRKIAREEALEELKGRVKATLANKLAKIDQAFLW